MDSVYLIIVSVGAPLLISLMMVALIIRLSHRYRWYDDINDRKIHTEDTPHIGGIGIFVASTVGVILLYILNSAVFEQALVSFRSFLPLLIAFALIHITGVIDDFTAMHARYKFVIQLVVAGVLAALGYTIKSVALPWFDIVIKLGPAAYVITVIWLAGVSNAINFIDGIDGLAGGVSAIAALAYGILFMIAGAYTSAFIAFTMLGAIIGFLFFNWPPAKIFMGDSGAIYLGFALGALPLLEHSGDVTLLAIIIPFSLLLFPILDTLAAILRRLRRRLSPGSPDKEHTHHKLLDFGLKQPGVLAILYVLTALPCGAVILWAATGNPGFFWLVLATWIVSAVFFILLDALYHKDDPKPNNGQNPAEVTQ